ncbi:putative disease resistance protein [Vitis vinifera]|uniref:Putative disease resistance protein n=1 Tax=Vitis vinifera TaxID=29760 RepID=A0A438CQ71_VITVI|nr:putative disease resistance protein [Vitis vinifera]
MVGNETRGQGGMFLEREDEGGERELDFLAIVSLFPRPPPPQSFAVRGQLHLGSMKWLLSFIGGMVAYSFLKMLHEYFTRKEREEVWRMMAEEFSRQSQSRDTESTVRISPQPTTQEPNLASFTDDVHTMVKRLLTDDKSFRVIPIMGIEGIGKTTLAKLIFNNKHVLNHFLFGVWTSDGYEFHLRDKEKLMDSSLSQLGDVWNYHVELQRLKAFLIDKRSLIVLDDTHIPFLDHVLRILAESSNGSRMILTTHKISLPPNFRTRSDPHLLRLRGDDESWALFTHALKKSIPPELLKLKDKIVRRCGGLPLLIVKLAEALSHKDATIEEWSTVLQQFHHDQQQLWSNTLYKIHKDLSLYMRRCLFYFTLFPQDFDIPARRLITFMVITIRHLVDHLDKEDVSFDHIHGDYNRTSTSFPPYYEDVLSFMSFDTRKESKPGEDIGNFLRQSISSGCFLVLLVLDLENVFRPKLPEAIGKLTRLRYFGLRSTFLEILPSSISKLQNVQTLDMKHTSINTLPDSIWKLQQLRHLYLSESYRSKLMLGQGTNFPTILQTLCELFVDEETPVRDGLDRLLNIRKLGLTMSSKQEAMSLQLQAVVDWVLKQKQLRSLRLKSIDQNNQPWDLELKPLVTLVNLSYIYLLGRLKNPSIMSQFPYSLIDLTLSASGLVEDPMQSLDRLPNLRSLKLLAKSYLGKNMLCSFGGFPQFRVLKLWKLEQLEEWNIEKGALQALRDLEIRFCRSLNILPAELLHRTLLKIEVIPAQAHLKLGFHPSAHYSVLPLMNQGIMNTMMLWV